MAVDLICMHINATNQHIVDANNKFLYFIIRNEQESLHRLDCF